MRKRFSHRTEINCRHLISNDNKYYKSKYNNTAKFKSKID